MSRNGRENPLLREGGGYNDSCRFISSLMGKEDFGSEATRHCSIGKWVQPLRSTALSSFDQTWGKSASTVLSGIPTVPYGSEWRTGPGLGLERFRNGVLTPVVLPNFDGSKLNIVQAIMEDSDKNLWIATYGNGIYRIHGQTVDHFGRADGLSSDASLICTKATTV
jgi:hypothetical protein